MTDHLDEAATRASELAGELDRVDDTAVTNAQRHLIYLAGLIRGWAARRSNDVYEGGWFTWPASPTADDDKSDAPVCQYCGADCSDGRNWDGDDLYSCPRCARIRTLENEVKAWGRATEQARAQRDELLHALRQLLKHPVTGPISEMNALREVVEQIERDT